MTLPVCITFHVIEHQHLSPGERSAILELLSRAYEEEFESFQPYYEEYTHVLMYTQDRLAAHVCWEERTLELDNHPPLHIGYLESLATEPTLRGLGLGSAAMRVVEQQIWDCDLGVLCAETPDFHARLGWEVWRGPIFVRHDTGLVPASLGPLMILRTGRTPAWLDLDSPIVAPWTEETES